jgi:hypothetical protein
MKDPKNWPPKMREEWGDDEGLETARKYRAELVRGLRAARRAIDEFAPDFVLIFGDDHAENIQEDLIPSFAIFAIEEVECKLRQATRNHQQQDGPASITIKGHTAAANHIARELIWRGFEVACSWKLPHGESYGHAMVNTVSFLDLDGVGFPYPVIPVAVNCYGNDLPVAGNPIIERQIIGRRRENEAVPPPPPSPVPWRCYDLGKAVAKIIEESPWRAVVIGSSSWSHAFLTAKHNYLFPDMEADRARREELFGGEQAKWRELDPEQIIDSGQQEFLNWICLAGAMEGRKAQILSLSEAYLFNSNKLVAVFPVHQR